VTAEDICKRQKRQEYERKHLHIFVCRPQIPVLKPAQLGRKPEYKFLNLDTNINILSQYKNITYIYARFVA
jgi:hypothetical protein